MGRCRDKTAEGGSASARPCPKKGHDLASSPAPLKEPATGDVVSRRRAPPFGSVASNASSGKEKREEEERGKKGRRREGRRGRGKRRRKREEEEERERRGKRRREGERGGKIKIKWTNEDEMKWKSSY